MVVRRRNYTRILAIIVAISMIGGIAVSLFIMWPLLLPFLLVAGAAVFVYFRFFRGKAGK